MQELPQFLDISKRLKSDVKLDKYNFEYSRDEINILKKLRMAKM